MKKSPALTHVKFKFAIGHYNGTMSMKIWANDKIILDQDKFDATEFEWETKFEWPSILKIELQGKDNNHDTKVENDKIVADKYIQLIDLTVDRISANLDRICLITTQGEKINTAYWGFNGAVNLNFDSKDSFSWLLEQKSSNTKSNYVVDWLRTEGAWQAYQNKGKNVQSTI